MHLLVVEDDESTLFYLQRILNEMGYQVTTAEDGQQALQVLESFKPDLVISDLLMPNVTGPELYSKVRNQIAREVPFVFISGATGFDDFVDQQWLRDASAFLAKPFDMDQLKGTVRQLLSEREIPIPSE